MAETTFDPVLTGTVPAAELNGSNIYQGTFFVVEFFPVAGSDAGCSRGTPGQELSGEGLIQTDGTLVFRAAGLPSLVDRPEGSNSRCSYDVRPDDNFIANNNERLDLVSDEFVTISGVNPEASAHYGTSFSPDISITVPLVDENGDGINDFAGTEFPLRLVDASFASSFCRQVGQTWRVNDDGSVTRQGPATRLVGRAPGASDFCQYRVELPASVSVAEGVVLVWEATTQFINEADISQTVAYRVSENTFSRLTFPSRCLSLTMTATASLISGVMNFPSTSFPQTIPPAGALPEASDSGE